MNRQTNFHKAIILTGVFLLVLFLGLIGLYSRSKRPDNFLKKQLEDTLVVKRNKNGEEVARIAVLEANNYKQLLELESKDEEIQRLQGILKEYKSKANSVTTFKTNTKVNTVTKTTILYDTITKEEKVEIYPIYESDINLHGWVEGNIKASKDSIETNLIVNNEYSVIVGKDKKELFVDVINHNPHSSTEKLRAVIISQPKLNKKFSIGPYIGMGINQEGKFIPNLGVGLQYNLIKL